MVPLGFVHIFKGVALKKYAAFIRSKQTDNVLEDYAFAGTAFADNGGDFVFIYLKINPIQYCAAPKALGNVFKFDYRQGHFGTFLSPQALGALISVCTKLLTQLELLSMVGVCCRAVDHVAGRQFFSNQPD